MQKATLRATLGNFIQPPTAGTMTANRHITNVNSKEIYDLLKCCIYSLSSSFSLHNSWLEKSILHCQVW